MSIDVEPRDLGKVVQLVAKNDGWPRKDTTHLIDHSIYIGGNPNTPFNQTPEHLREPFKEAWLTTKQLRPTDFNGLKVAVTRLTVVDGILNVEGVDTDYYTLWGLPKAEATKQLFATHEKEIVVNKAVAPNADYKADLPWGACSHNILLDRNGDVLMMVRSQSQGFNAGRVSATEEEQTEVKDSSVFATSARSFREELDLIIPQRKVRLLGVAMEKGAAYPAFAFITETDVLAVKLIDKWRKARDYSENTALFAVPMTQVDRWVKSEEITPEIWGNNFLAGGISFDARLKLHATSSWRINLAKEYASLAK